MDLRIHCGCYCTILSPSVPFVDSAGLVSGKLRMCKYQIRPISCDNRVIIQYWPPILGLIDKLFSKTLEVNQWIMATTTARSRHQDALISTERSIGAGSQGKDGLHDGFLIRARSVCDFQVFNETESPLASGFLSVTSTASSVSTVLETSP